MTVLETLEPKAVFKHFESIARIPHESGNEKAISDFLMDFARAHHLEAIQEPSYNVIIKKEATPGYENAPSVILQGHMDMVCVKEEGVDFDFLTDPLTLRIEEDMIWATGTSLGADNGIAVAMVLALLESTDLPHPELTALFTVSEETGMDGVLNLNSNNLTGQILINLDTEEEGSFITSCAGGVNHMVYLPLSHEAAKAGHAAFKLNLQGLKGGHSGIEINKNRANALHLMGRVLADLDRDFDLDISAFSGGEKMNAIPKFASATVLVPETEKEALQDRLHALLSLLKNEYAVADPDLEMEIQPTEIGPEIWNHQTRQDLIALLRLIPVGVQSMSASIEGLVESSTNLGVAKIDGNELVLENAVRSSVKSRKAEINQRIQMVCEKTAARSELVSDYPEWEFQVESPIRELFVSTYEELHGTTPKIEAIHAGLECGFLKEKLGDIDMISMGPNMYDVHTPNEHLSISSTKRVYEFLCEILKRVQ